MDALEGPEQRHAGTKPKFQRSPLATVGESPGGEGWQPGTQPRCCCRVQSRETVEEGSDAGHLGGRAGSISDGWGIRVRGRQGRGDTTGCGLGSGQEGGPRRLRGGSPVPL